MGEKTRDDNLLVAQALTEKKLYKVLDKIASLTEEANSLQLTLELIQAEIEKEYDKYISR